jgi:hypothetical protein
MEGEMIFTALAARVARIELAGEPQRRISNGLRQFGSVPAELIPG